MPRNIQINMSSVYTQYPKSHELVFLVSKEETHSPPSGCSFLSIDKICCLLLNCGYNGEVGRRAGFCI